MSTVITDPVEAAAQALARHKQLRWEAISPWWKAEQRRQVRIILSAAAAASAGGYRSNSETDEPDLFDHEGGQP